MPFRRDDGPRNRASSGRGIPWGYLKPDDSPHPFYKLLILWWVQQDSNL